MPKLATEDKLRRRCETLAEILIAVSPIYARSTNVDTQLHFIETIIGASVWYLPEMKLKLWTGKVSASAIESCRGATAARPARFTADHEYPRKLAAVELLRRQWGEEEDAAQVVYDLYLTRYGRFRYVTPIENTLLVGYQKKHIFTDPESAYRSAKLRFATLTWAELAAVRAGDNAVICESLSRAV